MSCRMNNDERQTLQKMHLDLVTNIDPKFLMDYIFQKECISEEDMELLDAEVVTQRRARQFLVLIKRKCSMTVFLASMRYNKTYDFLADRIEELMTKSPTCNHRKRRIESDSGEFRPSKQMRENEGLIIYPPPRKINTDSKKKAMMTQLAHHMKRLRHEGKLEAQDKFVKALGPKLEHDADIRFTLLDAKASSLRVTHDKSLPGSDLFSQMEATIPYTTNPTASSMNYLARKGSVVAMVQTQKEGLQFLEYAKMHAENIVPGRDTGMVFYIEVNLLMQEFEHNPSKESKQNVIDRVSLAISHFNFESEEVKKYYTRMLYLKMACCYLGIGVLANTINGYHPETNDITKALSCLELVDQAWEGIDIRRKMFYYLTRAMAYKYQNNIDKARENSGIARKWAEKGHFDKELPNIMILSMGLAEEFERSLETEGGDLLLELANSDEIRPLPNALLLS